MSTPICMNNNMDNLESKSAIQQEDKEGIDKGLLPKKQKTSAIDVHIENMKLEGPDVPNAHNQN